MAKRKSTRELPNKIKEIQGTLEKSRVPDNPFVPESFDGTPDPPEDLGKIGKRIWTGTVSELQENGMLYNLDIPMLHIYCQEYENYQMAEKELKNNGRVIEQTNKAGATNLVQSPWINIKSKSWEVIKAISLQFGLTPLARNKIEVPEKPKEDDITKLLDRKNK